VEKKKFRRADDAFFWEVVETSVKTMAWLYAFRTAYMTIPEVYFHFLNVNAKDWMNSHLQPSFVYHQRWSTLCASMPIRFGLFWPLCWALALHRKRSQETSLSLSLSHSSCQAAEAAADEAAVVALLKDGQQRGFSPGAFSPGAQEERCVLQFQQDECTIVGAAANGDLRAVRGFLRRDPQNLYKKSSGDTALHLAADNAKLEVVQFLVSARAEINAKNYKGETPLDDAKEWEFGAHRAMVIKILEQNGGKRGRDVR